MTKFEKKLTVASFLCLGVSIVAVGTAFKAANTAREHEKRASLYYTRARSAELDLGALRERMKQTYQERGVTFVAGREGTLAQKNENPANIKILPHGKKWVGQIGVDKFGHARFSSPEYGLRAAAMCLLNYEKKHKIDTVAALVRRFSTSNHAEYERFLCKNMHLKPTQKFSIRKRLPELLRHMVAFESGKKIDKKHLATLEAMASL